MAQRGTQSRNHADFPFVFTHTRIERKILGLSRESTKIKLKIYLIHASTHSCTFIFIPTKSRRKSEREIKIQRFQENEVPFIMKNIFSFWLHLVSRKQKPYILRQKLFGKLNHAKPDTSDVWISDPDTLILHIKSIIYFIYCFFFC